MLKSYQIYQGRTIYYNGVYAFPNRHIEIENDFIGVCIGI